MDIKPKILVVDDERFYINVLVELLQNDYRICFAALSVNTTAICLPCLLYNVF
jgi:CheY-like chemotaxis protein